MVWRDLFRLALGSITSHKQRSLLTALGLIIGIAAVVILTSIGRGVHGFVLGEFTQFGTHLLAVYPGKTTTFGLSGATISTVRPLTAADAESLQSVESVLAAMPLVQGNARIEAGGKQRRSNVFGVGPALPQVWRIGVDSGRFLPEEGADNARPFAVLGSKVRQELFGEASPLGQRIRIGSDRFRVVGVMRSKGQMLGFDLDDTVFIPSARAMEMFDRQGLMEIDVLYRGDASAERVEQAVKQRLLARHGAEDFTIVTQNQMLEKMDSVLSVLTLAVAALGGISLLVGSVGILTIMTIAVSERVAEIGLLRAIGAERGTVFRLFLAEAVLLSLAGGSGGVGLGVGVVKLVAVLLPALPVQLAWNYIGLAFAVSLAIGAAAGVAPAVKAARLKPLDALRAE
ncbi:ABC transporter permease [Methylomonas koyamae]|uniref:Peptide ABC transporter permease n=1 Tax=Methylomonas koyamae TaxID=702114 RepID=A0A291IPS1_9GAMM|nr:ABC transporter permease [Methylomonas koyamae]ATG92230.1 peptide ABC transporter permease [Methylomonas koyamae]OAI25027.1 peptide ABC transporter permease [Methylomonas koyamae]